MLTSEVDMGLLSWIVCIPQRFIDGHLPEWSKGFDSSLYRFSDSSEYSNRFISAAVRVR